MWATEEKPQNQAQIHATSEIHNPNEITHQHNAPKSKLPLASPKPKPGETRPDGTALWPPAISSVPGSVSMMTLRRGGCLANPPVALAASMEHTMSKHVEAWRRIR
ncbi:hypothetical protein KC19_VG319900 [Ceratodon purpureus]|uniref:Uncharacterized protein n=1 Tax=Ceratodon purpureus TaxID=3225 RepID=A0A8T0HVG4_CERPU|nr:hypothetical protein KC19_9G042000 [Ceratodon purpureus]KAG0575050.1 hypothetical protein KC19_VG313500 [Ceratodon purpureus]KAG0575117.1 hypothetical protein KC19_VG319900 [Ceratodon purpureus]